MDEKIGTYIEDMGEIITGPARRPAPSHGHTYKGKLPYNGRRALAAQDEGKDHRARGGGAFISSPRGPPVALFHRTPHATAMEASQLGGVCG